MPGVFKVITYKDILAAGGTNQINGLVMLPKHNKTDGFERPVLCSDKIFQFGDAIAIVAADTEAHARAAADAVKVEIEELPAYMSAPDAMAPDAIEIHPGTPNVFYETNCIKGDDFDWDSIPDAQQVEIESYCSPPVSPTCIWSPTAAMPTSTRTAWSPCTPSPSASICTCP